MKGFALGVLATIVGLVALVFFKAASLGPQPQPEPGGIPLRAVSGCVPDSKTLPAPLSRVELESSLIGKSTQETCFKIGVPISTSKSGDTEYWYYAGVTEDPVTKKQDQHIQIRFEDGKVQSISF